MKKKTEADCRATKAKSECDKFSRMSDENLACTLIMGVIEFRQTKGTSPTPIRRYFKPGSQQERDARAAMARYLRSETPKTQEFLSALANWFEGRGRGQPEALIRDKTIASFIHGCRLQGDTVKIAKEKAEKNYGLSDETIRGIWKRRKSLLGNLLTINFG